METIEPIKIKDYKPFKNKRKGLFSVEKSPGEYVLSKGWLQVEKEYEIIGETNDLFVMSLFESTWGEWVGDIVIQKTYIIPKGIHRSRLISWQNAQLSLFE